MLANTRCALKSGDVMQVPHLRDIRHTPVEHLLQAIGNAQDVLKRLADEETGAPKAWLALATVQLLHMATRGMLHEQMEDACRGQEPSCLLRKHVEPLFEVCALATHTTPRLSLFVESCLSCVACA
jgi:hypothetical protein